MCSGDSPRSFLLPEKRRGWLTQALQSFRTNTWNPSQPLAVGAEWPTTLAGQGLRGLLRCGISTFKTGKVPGKLWIWLQLVTVTWLEKFTLHIWASVFSYAKQKECLPWLLHPVIMRSDQIRSDQSLSSVRLFATPLIAAMDEWTTTELRKISNWGSLGAQDMLRSLGTWWQEAQDRSQTLEP